jgi:hypothetical protein
MPTSTPDSPRPYKPLSPEGKGRVLGNLRFMQDAGLLRPFDPKGATEAQKASVTQTEDDDHTENRPQ